MIRTKKKSEKVPNDVVTIITVVLNGEKFLEKTINSVINQNYSNIEYIVIDGGSTDQTINIIKKYKHAIHQYISEKDLGIYDAMNKGVKLATGHWINFMNCGDSFYSNHVLHSIFHNKKLINVDVIYGYHEVIYPSGKTRLVPSGKIENLWKGSQFSHQASFARSSILKRNRFNLNVKFSADFYLFYNLWLKHHKFKRLNITVASILSGGVSDVNRIKVIREWRNIVGKNGYNFFYFSFKVFMVLMKMIIKKIMKIGRF